MDTWIEFGLEFIGTTLQPLSPGLDGLMNGASFLGMLEFYLIIIPVIFWVVNPRLGIRMLLMLLLVDVVSIIGKLALHQPRPYWMGDENVRLLALEGESSYGIPSSHASGTLAVYGYLAWHASKKWLWGLVAGVVLLVGISRMYLGVHFPHDVLVGWALGLALIVAFIRLEPLVAGWFARQSTATRIWIGVAAGVLVVIVGWLTVAAIANVSDPPLWARFAAEAHSLKWAFTDGGALVGAIIGYVLMRKHSQFDGSGTALQRVGRVVVGFTGALVILFGLGGLFDLLAEDGTLLSHTLRFLHYGIATFWMTWGAVWTFQRIGLFTPPAADQLATVPNIDNVEVS